MPFPIRAAALSAACAALLVRPAPAQTRAITVLGYVTDTASAPVPAAEVVVEGVAGTARTDERGAFTLAGLRPGKLVLTVRRLGFRARSDQFRTAPGDTLQILLDLVPVPRELAEVKVTEQRLVRRQRTLDEFDARRGRGFGSFVTRADIERRRPMHTSDVFRSLSGVTVLAGRAGTELRMTRSRDCAPDIYIDGREMKGYRIDDIPPSDIGGIEVFQGPSETPPRFRRAEAGCGVVSIWTREPGES
jgi:hypothetical protein